MVPPKFPERSEVWRESGWSSGDLRISLPFIAVDDYGSPLQLEEELSRKEFESICAPLLERLKDPVQKALKDAGLRYQDLDEVVLLDCTQFRHVSGPLAQGCPRHVVMSTHWHHMTLHHIP